MRASEARKAGCTLEGRWQLRADAYFAYETAFSVRWVVLEAVGGCRVAAKVESEVGRFRSSRTCASDGPESVLMSRSCTWAGVITFGGTGRWDVCSIAHVKFHMLMPEAKVLTFAGGSAHELHHRHVSPWMEEQGRYRSKS